MQLCISIFLGNMFRKNVYEIKRRFSQTINLYAFTAMKMHALLYFHLNTVQATVDSIIFP